MVLEQRVLKSNGYALLTTPRLCFGEGNGNSLQCSCLENPSDRGAWWATIYGVAQSRTQLKRLSSSSLESSLRGQNKEKFFLLVDLLHEEFKLKTLKKCKGHTGKLVCWSFASLWALIALCQLLTGRPLDPWFFMDRDPWTFNNTIYFILWTLPPSDVPHCFLQLYFFCSLQSQGVLDANVY